MRREERRGSARGTVRNTRATTGSRRTLQPLSGDRHEESGGKSLISPERSAMMARIGERNTAPEIAVRRILHRLGSRFRLHRRDLPGTPDIVLPGRKLASWCMDAFGIDMWAAGSPICPKTRVDSGKRNLTGTLPVTRSTTDAHQARLARACDMGMRTPAIRRLLSVGFTKILVKSPG